MSEPKIGSFCWVELASSDADIAKEFYKNIFNWNYHDEKLPDDMGAYTSAMANGKPAAAIFNMPQAMKDMGIPPHWGSYIRVENVDQSAKKASGLGAEILKSPFDVMEAGRMASLRDPAGAVFHIWEKKATAGATVQNESEGAFSWNELWVYDLAAAKKFYEEMFSWKASNSDFNGKTYVSLKRQDDQPAGGMMQIQKDMGEVPPHWAVYFTVDDIEKSIDSIKGNGGKVFFGPQDIEEVGQFAVCADPSGAAFSIIQFKK